MWRRKLLTIWTAFCFSIALHAAESFTIRSAGPFGDLGVHYQIGGTFGGYGGFVRGPGGDGAYRIPLQYEGKPAVSLKAILYARGCQFTLFSVDLKADRTRSARFECRPLPTVTLNGRISPPPPSTRVLDIEIRYLSFWDHEFFEIMDGPVGSFSLGKAPLKADGRFQIEIPDFSKDSVTSQKKDAILEVLVVEHATWNIVEWVVPTGDAPHPKIGLPIQPDYGSEVEFTKRQ